LREAPSQFQIVAVADQLPERRTEAERDFGCATYPDYRDMIKEGGFDLFINSLPSFLHPKGTIKALKAGHNVVCEKPLARKLKDFDKMVKASRKSGKHLLPFQNSRFYPFFRKMRQVIDSGVLGEILHIRSVWSGFGRRWDWQTLQKMHGGNLLNTGPHSVDHAVMLFGPKKPKVFCRMKSIQPFGGDAEDFCLVTLYGKESPVVEIVLSSYLLHVPKDRYLVCGEYGGMAGGPAGLRWQYFDPAQAPTHELWTPWSRDRQYCSESLPWVKKSWKPRKSKVDDFQANSRAFYNNVYDVLTKDAEPVVKLSEVRRQIGVMEECHRQNPLPKRGKRKDS